MATWEDLQRALGREVGEDRWTFSWDMNADGLVTISDIWSVVGWVFFAPGDLLISTTITFLPAVATFFELSPAFYGGWLSAIFSAFCWLLIAKQTSALLAEILSFFVQTGLSRAKRRDEERRLEAYIQQARLDPNAPRGEAEARLWAEQDRKYEEAKAARLKKLRPQ